MALAIRGFPEGSHPPAGFFLRVEIAEAWSDGVVLHVWRLILFLLMVKLKDDIS